MSELQLDNVVKFYGDVPALQGVSFSVAEGEFFCILGPSAAGKTTTLKAIAGLERAQQGRILFRGNDVTHARVQGRAMAMIFQTFALYPHINVRGNLSYGLIEAKIDKAEIARRVDEVGEMLRITHTLERLPSTLSGGEQQRVAIGRALVRRPRLLLLDEPLTNLDAKLRHDTRAEFKRLHRELGMTMVYATPDQLEALTMGERIGILQAGRIVQSGTPYELYDCPDNNFVATLVGAPAMNLLPAKRVQSPDGAAAELSFAAINNAPWATALSEFPVGTELLFGIRPQDIRLAGADSRGPRIDARVRLTEPLGDITVLDLTAGDDVFKMVLLEEQALGFAAGDRIELELSIERSHVFTQETGVAIR